MAAASSHYRKMLAILDKGPAHPGIGKMREEIERCIASAEKEVFAAQPDQMKLECTTTVLTSAKEEVACLSRIAKLERSIVTERAHLAKIQRDIGDNQEALVAIQSAMAVAGQTDDYMEHDDGHYGWYERPSWKRSWQGGYEDQWQDLWQEKEDNDESYQEQLAKLYSRLDREATPESLMQAAQLTNHFAEKVSELMVTAATRGPAPLQQPMLQQQQGASAPATPHRNLQLPSPGVAPSPLAPAASAPMGLSPSRTPVVTSGAVSAIPVGGRTGRKVKSTTAKPKHNPLDKSVKISVETVSSGEEESGDDMADVDGQPASVAEAGVALAMGFTVASATEAPP